MEVKHRFDDGGKPSLHAVDMKIGERIRAARERAKLTQEQLAERLGIRSQAVNQWEKGKTSPDRTRLARLAQILDIGIEQLLDPSAPDDLPAPAPEAPAKEPVREVRGPGLELPGIGTMPRDVPVYGVAVGGHDTDFTLNGQVIDYVRRPPGILSAKGVFAIYVVGTSMWPRYEDGDLIYLHPDRPARAGDDVVIEMIGDGHSAGECYLKRLLRRSPTRLVCQQFNPARNDLEYDLAAVKKVYRVIPQAELLGV